MRRLLTVRRAAIVGAAVTALLVSACTPTVRPNADYQFSTNSVRACAADDGPDLSLLTGGGGTTSRVVENVDGKSEHVVRFSKGAGLRLKPTTGEAGNTTYSIVVLFRHAEVTGYRRVIDVKHGTHDYGVYLFNGLLLAFGNNALGDEPVAANEWVQVVITRTGGGTTTGYLDGVQEWQFPDSTANFTIDGSNELRFFQDNGGINSGESSAGAVARIRVFNRALSAAEVRNLGQTPSNPCAT